jgi:hypothetical protein
MVKTSKKRSQKRSQKKSNKKSIKKSIKKNNNKKITSSNILVSEIEKKVENARASLRKIGLPEPNSLRNVPSKKIAKGINDTNKMITVVYLLIVKNNLNEYDGKKVLLRLNTPSGKKLIGGSSVKYRQEVASNLYSSIKNLNWESLIKNNVLKHYKFNTSNKHQFGGFLNKLEECYEPVGDMLDSTQTILDTMGMIPPAGFLFDLMSVSMNTLRNKPADAMFSLISMVPIAGDIVGKGLKYLRDKPELAQTLVTAWQMQTLREMQEKQRLGQQQQMMQQGMMGQ